LDSLVVRITDRRDGEINPTYVAIFPLDRDVLSQLVNFFCVKICPSLQEQIVCFGSFVINGVPGTLAHEF
jgi:hypothetical protein